MTTIRLLAVAVLGCAGLSSVARGDEAEEQLKALLEAKAPSIVSIKAVIRTEVSFLGQSQNEESRINIQGVVVDPGGLVLVSNAHFAFDLPGMQAGVDIKIIPIEFKVIVDREEKQYDAFLAAKDTKLNVAFLQIKDLGDRKLAPIKLETEAKPGVGQAVVAVSRLDEGYDYAPYFRLARISGSIKKPRRALMHSGGLDALGLPVFTLAGEPVGVLTTLASGLKPEEETASGGPMGALAMLRGEGVNSFVLPARSIKGVVKQALERATEMLAEQAEAGEEKKEGEEKEGEEKEGEEKEEGGEEKKEAE